MKATILAMSALALTVATAFADPAEDREAYMKESGHMLGQLAPYAKGEKPFDAEEVMALLDAFNEHAQEFDVAALFPEGTAGGSSRAAPAIWEDFGDFTAHVDKFKADAATAAAAEPQNARDVGMQLGMIGKNCQSCHEVYRLPEN